MHQKQPQIAVTEAEIQYEIAISTSFLPAMAGAVAVKSHVSRKPSNSSRRKRTPQGPRGIQAPYRREIWSAILHYQPGWQGCSSVSLRGMAADRGKAGAALEFQSGQEEVSQPDQLLRAGGGDGWTGQAAGSGPAARFSRDQRRSGGGGQPDVSRGTDHRGLPQGHRGEPVHCRR